MLPQPPLAAFDFDGTISDRDSLKDFVRFAVGPLARAAAYARATPTVLQWSVGMQSRQAAKAAFLRASLGGIPQSRLLELGRTYAAQALPRLLRPEMLAQVRAHRDRGHRLVLVSASPAFYLQPWASAHGFEAVLATELAYSPQGIFEGQWASPNCWGAEKVHRLSQWLGTPEVRLTYAYGDSQGDVQMLACAEHPWHRGRQTALPSL